jgi:thiamine biosynthesis lipoprotein
MRIPTQLLLSRPSDTGWEDRPTSGEVRAWGGRATVSVEDPSALAPALRLARHHLRSVGRACDGHHPAAQVHLIPAAAGEPVRVGPLLLRHVRAALETADVTEGLVDPTVVPARGLGSPPPLPVCSRGPRARPARGWRCVQVTDDAVRAPGGTALDLTASALPVALDDVARVVAQLTCGAVGVTLHGRTAWCDRDGRSGGTAATDGRRVVDPRTGEPAARRWSWVEVSAGSARTASALAVAAVLRGDDAPAWLAGRCTCARLLGSDGTVVLVGEPAPPASGRVRASAAGSSAA